MAPYFRIWDKSVTDIASSVAFLPAHSPSPQQTAKASNDGSNVSPRNAKYSSSNAIIGNTGAFAYFIEALESLCQVNEYFLKQNINFDNRREVLIWLTRFKELDFRLVQYVRWDAPLDS